MKRSLVHGASFVIGLGLTLLGVIVARTRAEVAVHPPTPPAPPNPTDGAPAYQAVPSVEHVALRLTERLGTASVDLPSLGRGLEALRAHPRRMQAPWRVTKDTTQPARAELVQLVALPTGTGALAQREAIVAPTPSILRFRLRVPMDAAFEVAPAVLAVSDARTQGPIREVTFVARAMPVGGVPVELGRVVVREGDRDRWHERRFDLGALAGEEIDLELVAEADGTPTTTAVALWGTPRIMRRAAVTLPRNVLTVVVDALRPDVIASFHDEVKDAAKREARHPPGDALLPAIPGLARNLDALADRATVFRDATSAGSWTLPGLLAMSSGRLPRASTRDDRDAHPTSDPPLLGLALRRAGAATRAFVSDDVALGHAPLGVDLGFEQVELQPFEKGGVAGVTRLAIEAMRAHAGERWFHFVHYRSPREPYEPSAECLSRVPSGSFDEPVRAYLAEACEADAAIGELLAEIDRLGLRERTLVVVTAAHGETLAAAHDVVAVGLGNVRTRFHHAFGLWEETTRIPILLSLPGVVPEGRAIDVPVTNLDLPKTIFAIQGLEADPRHEGIDLLAIAKGAPAPERPIVSLGPVGAAVRFGRYRYVEREKQAQRVAVGTGKDRAIVTIPRELYDLVDDPGETTNLASKPEHEGTVAELRARLRAALEGVTAADAAVTQSAPAPKILLRFAGGGRARRVHATISAPGATTVAVTPIGIPEEAVRTTKDESGATIDVATVTAADALVGLDVVVQPAPIPLGWSFAFDDVPLGDDAVFGGELGIASPGLAKGLLDPASRAAVSARSLPFIDPRVDDGVFVVRVVPRPE